MQLGNNIFIRSAGDMIKLTSKTRGRRGELLTRIKS